MLHCTSCRWSVSTVNERTAVEYRLWRMLHEARNVEGDLHHSRWRASSTMSMMELRSPSAVFGFPAWLQRRPLSLMFAIMFIAFVAPHRFHGSSTYIVYSACPVQPHERPVSCPNCLCLFTSAASPLATRLRLFNIKTISECLDSWASHQREPGKPCASVGSLPLS